MFPSYFLFSTAEIGLGTAGCLALTSALGRAGCLEEFDFGNYELEKNRISDKDAATLVASLPQSITKLSMQGLVNA